jgi:hypothetical protein
MWRLTLLTVADKTNKNQRPIIRRPNEASRDTLIRKRTREVPGARARFVAAFILERRRSL